MGKETAGLDMVGREVQNREGGEKNPVRKERNAMKEPE